MGNWEGIYSRFSEIPFETKTYNEKRIAENSYHFVSALVNNNEHLLVETKDRSLLSFFVSFHSAKNSSINILDFGGGVGTDYVVLYQNLPFKYNISYHVVENPEMVKCGLKIFENDKSINFYDSLPENLKPDLVYSCGTLQYIEDYEEIIERLCEYKAPFVMFVKASLVKCLTYVSLQKGVAGFNIPYLFINENDFIKNVERCGYKLIFKAKSEREYDQSNFEPEFRMDRTTDLLFALKQEDNND